ncbi:ATP-binding protein [Streptomyces collinus]
MRSCSQAVATLRRFAQDVAETWGTPDETVYALCVVTSELVTNAVLHSGSASVELTMYMRGFTATIQVKDGGRWIPHETANGRPADDEVHGRGLHIVRGYTSRCAISSTTQGTTVRAEMDMSTPSTPGSI